jgi:hypothetical protein
MRRIPAVVVLLSTLALCTATRAVILFSTGDPTSHTMAPGGALSNSGWQYVGQFGTSPDAYVGTAIGPHAFITAAHVTPGIGSTFTYNGVPYTVATTTGLANRDLVVVRVNGTLPSWAPIYNESVDGSLLANKTGVIIGRGTQRGSAINVTTSRAPEGTLRGWNWGPIDSVQRWGTNVISDFSVVDPMTGAAPNTTKEYFRFGFDFNGLADEAIISNKDSGGGVFVQGANGVWKSAGIVTAVEAGYRLSATGADSAGAIFDYRDLFIQANDGNYYTAQTFYGSASPITAKAYISNVSDVSAAELATFVPRAGDANCDGAINSTDFNTVSANFNISSGADWFHGDFNYDGKVNALDFNALATNFGLIYTLAGASSPALGTVVPEPASTALALGVGALLLRRRR